MIEFLVNINQELIKKYEENPEKEQRQLIISNFLKQKNCFFKISIDDAFNILKDLEIANYEETYIKLIDYSEYIKD